MACFRHNYQIKTLTQLNRTVQASLNSIKIMAATIILLRNVLTHLYLTYSLGIISFDNFKNFPSKSSPFA